MRKLLTVLLLVSWVGCGGGFDPPEIPEPAGLTALGREVRQQYADFRRAIDEAPDDSRLATAYGHMGMWHDLYEFPQTALACYEAASTLDPDEPRWFYYRGHVLRELGRAGEARAALERVLSLAPDSVAARVWAGEVELSEGREADAEARFRAALDADPDCVRCLHGLGRVSLLRRDWEEAVSRLEQALARQPSATGIHYSLGLAYRGAGDDARARRHLEIGQVPNRERIPVKMQDPWLVDLQSLRRDQHALNRRAKTLLEEGRVEEAIEALERLVELDPDTADWRNNLALALLRVGRDAEAAVQLEEILRRDPRAPRALFGRALIRARASDAAGAEADYRAAVDADPGFLQARFNLADLLRRQGRNDEARREFAEVVRIDPANRLARYWRAQTLIAGERWAEARDVLEQDLAELESGAEGSRVLAARVLAAAPDPAVRDGRAALEIARDGHRRTGGLAHAESVAMALAELGRYEEAAEWQSRCLAAVRAAGHERAVAWVRARLERYEAGRRAARPWEEGEESTRVVVEDSDNS